MVRKPLSCLCLVVDAAKQRNTFTSGGQARFSTSTNNFVKRNTFPDDFAISVDETSCFDSRSQSLAEPVCED